jgi:hypothetical protein
MQFIKAKVKHNSAKILTGYENRPTLYNFSKIFEERGERCDLGFIIAVILAKKKILELIKFFLF